MPRAPFALTDDQARRLTASVARLQATYPYDARNHRPFVRGFLRAVLDATGQLYSPAIYQRLLTAYAPERRPSTTTLAAEKAALAAEPPARPALAAGAHTSGTLAQSWDSATVLALVSDAIDAGLARAARFGTGGASQLDFYAARLREAEQALLAMRAEAARLAAELAAAHQTVSEHQRQTERTQVTLDQQAATITKLTAEVTDIRTFALRSIDDARGETRLWKERSVALEGQRQLDARLLETFRQQAYRAGAAIPDALRQDKPR